MELPWTDMVRSVDREDLEEVGFRSSVLHMLKLGYILDIQVEIVRGQVSMWMWSRGGEAMVCSGVYTHTHGWDTPERSLDTEEVPEQSRRYCKTWKLVYVEELAKEMWSPAPRPQVRGLVLRPQKQSPESRSPQSWLNPFVTIAKRPLIITSQLLDPKLSKNAHLSSHPIAPNWSPNANLLAEIFFVLRL